MADSFSMIPSGASMIGKQVSDYISQSSGSSGDSVSSAATSAKNAAEVSDKMIQDIIRHSVPMGGDMSQMVQNRPQVILPQPIRPKQIPMGEPAGQVNATSAGGQRRNDIGSLISSVSNIVKGSINKKREKEDQALMSDLAIIEAASSQPNDPHNRAILDEIAGDPARVKRLEKALGHNPLAGEPPPPEAQTMAKYAAQSQQKKQQKTQQITQAIAQHLGPQAAGQQGQSQQGGGAMDNLMSRMPNTPQLSPVVQLQAELIKAGILPKADTSLNAMKDMIKDVMTNDAKYAEIKGRVEASKNVALGRWWAAVEQAKSHYETTVLAQSGANQRAALRSEDYNKRTALMKEKLTKQMGEQKAANAIAVMQGYDKDIAAIQKEIDQVQARKDSKAADKLFQRLHDLQARKAAYENVIGYKDADIKGAGVGSGVNLLDLPPSTDEMDDEDNNLFQ
jgi:hypothetical protein